LLALKVLRGIDTDAIRVVPRKIPFVPGDERFFCLKELLNEVKFEWVRENTMIL
jgi:predicted component of type VI protein secretion system